MFERILRLSAEEGLDAERDALQRVFDGQTDAQLLFWRPLEQALVMPRRLSRLDGFAEAQAECAALGWPIALRDTGGEPVPQSAGVLNVALVYALPPDDDEMTRIETAYLRLCQPLCDWLTGFGFAAGLGEVPGAFCDGRYNVTLDGRKLVGTAQRWRRRQRDGRYVVLAHGAILMEEQRASMVEAVNVFYRGCGLPAQIRVDSHIALAERLAEPWQATPDLARRFQAPLAALGLPLTF
ncbi:MAG: Octanoyl-[GcvH]:protein N-octanoyltransferase [Stenotrophomonas maltophilia]|nr:MAG: Octanoyl-[GcvH]:protein N-octanoyltransferase [Stenotrophomonas maltophilia]